MGTELGSDGDYVFSATDFVPITPEGKEFYEKFKKKYGIEPSYHAARDYSMGMMLQQAIEAVGSLDQDKLLEYFMSGVKFKTLFGEITIGSYRDLKGITWPPSYYIVQWQNGKMVVVLPEDYAQAKPIFPMPSWEERGG
ncbi:MAG: hypothetical protein DRJ21_02275 [Candidatus Methanomethylicota archaeon]|uniref:Leucine-binding protein domain-containing protein n=1 Tax=Thermoproteota archaeon TaxID=2056631 RepID=A0A497EQH4_9CREN|nr:MAG: hypothetical protein DRJ21_02275 [Candidatus Verstraetearchaeota archaeon]